MTCCGGVVVVVVVVVEQPFHMVFLLLVSAQLV